MEGIITDKTISPVFKRLIYARGWLDIRAQELKQELAQGIVKPFDKVTWHFGDPHTFGQRPITFLRQLVCCLLCPNFLDDPSFPQDVRDKARRILNTTPGFDIEVFGMRIIREDVAKYISQRDGHPADPEFIILTHGGSHGIEIGLQSIETSSEDGSKRAGLMIPIPKFSHYEARALEYNHYQIHYYLDEDNNWALDIKELQRALDEARPHCLPRALVLINPGNPTGQILTRENIQEVIKFCAEEKLILFADEVYQEAVFPDGPPFHSCKKVLREMGPEYRNFQLMSIHSASKGFYGECCFRGGYLELVGFSEEVKNLFKRKLSANICSSVSGQAAIEAICNPPQPGNDSYRTFIKEKMAVLTSYQRKAKSTTSLLNSLEGVKCTDVTGAMYAYPKIVLPRKAIEAAKLNNLGPDEFYCWELLEATGTLFLPGKQFGQRSGTYHFRTTILPSEDTMGSMFEDIKRFHKVFMDKYRDADNNN